MTIIPEVIDLVEALTDIAASFKTQYSKAELCKTNQQSRAKPRESNRQARPERPRKASSPPSPKEKGLT